MEFPMTFMDYVATYGAAVATAVAALDFIKWKKHRAHVTLSCYLAKMVNNMIVPSGGRLCDGTSDEEDRRRKRFIAYKIKNTGGTPITVQSLGGKEKDGKLFVISGCNLSLPQTIQPHNSIVISVPLDEEPELIREFYVRDAIGKEWHCKAQKFQKQLAEYREKMGK
jgi:hypothetical protein